VTSVGRRNPAATSAGEEQEATRRAEVLASRKRVASADVISEWAVKWMLSPRPLVALPVPSSPVADVAERAGWSEERTGTRAPMGPVPTPGL